ncbi:MAG: PAC2 family protein [Chloroflexi bacterium]|nr:PAC2 family protein [Chloroflexota bacterium]
MPDLEFTERPQLDRSILVMAFAGWSDASDAATRAVRYIAHSYGARRFAWIDPEEFFDFTQLRPTVSVERERRRVISWPTSDFYYWRNPSETGRDVVMLIGIEPHLRWRRFASLVSEVVEASNVQITLTLGALLDAVPHSRPARVMATASAEDLGEGFEAIKLPGSRYEGPTGILSVVMELMSRRRVPCVSIWGRAPHYLQVRPNPQVTLAILREAQQFLPLKLDFKDLEKASAEFLQGLTKALEGQDQVLEYVKQLEARYDSEVAPSPGVPQSGPETQALITELEQFLRRRSGGDQGDINRG